MTLSVASKLLESPRIQQTTVGQICDQFDGEVQTGPFGSQLHASDYSEEGTPVVMPQDMVEGKISCERIARVDDGHVRRLSQHQLRTGDIVFSRRGDVTRFAVVTERESGWLCGTGSIRIRLNCPNVDIGYLRHYLQQEKIGSWLLHHAKGVTMPNLNTSIIRSIPLTLPPIGEQQRIAAILDEADAVRRKHEHAVALLTGLDQAIFADMFGKFCNFPPVHVRRAQPNLPNGWSWVALADVARLATGHTPDRKQASYWNGSIPWLSLGDIRSLDGKIAHSTAEQVTEEGIENSSSVLLPKGTVCFSRTASVGFATIMGQPMCTSQDFVNWVCGPRIDPVFLLGALIAARRELLSLASGSTHRTIYFPTAEKFQVLLPPIETQKRFAAMAGRVAIEYEKMKRRSPPLGTLFSSLQHRAFSGQL